MERSSAYEKPRYSEPERRRLVRRLLAREFQALYDQTGNPETKRFAEKVLVFLILKERIELEAGGQSRPKGRQERITPPADEGAKTQSPDLRQRDASEADASGGITTRKPPQQFGIFWAVEAIAEETMQDPESGFSLGKGDSYIELHLPPVEPENLTLKKVTSSLQSLAGYIDSTGLTPKYIMGITYERLADASRRMGFSVINPSLPPDLREGVERFNRAAVREGLKDEPMGQLLLAYQDGEAFLNRFSPNRSTPGQKPK